MPSRVAMADQVTRAAMMGSPPSNIFLGKYTTSGGRSGVDFVSSRTGAGSGVDSVSSRTGLWSGLGELLERSGLWSGLGELLERSEL